MTRGVEEGDGLAVDLHLIGADMLRDAAGFAGGDGGVSDIVEQTRFAVVDVTHDHDDGGAGLELVFRILMVVNELFFDRHDDFLFHLAAELFGNEGGGVKVDQLGKRRHHAVFHQALDDLGAGFLHARRQLSDGDLIGDLDGQGRLLCDLKLQTAHLLRLFLPALVGEGHGLLAAPVLAGIAELFLIALVHAAVAGTLRHILQLLVVLVKVDVCDLAGVDDLFLRHAGRRLLRCRGLALLRRTRSGSGRLCLRFGRGSRRRRGLRLLPGCRLLLLFRCALGKDRFDLHLILLRQILKYKIDLAFLQHLRGLFGGIRIGCKNRQNVL